MSKVNITELEKKVIKHIGNEIDGVDVNDSELTEEILHEQAVCSTRWKNLLEDIKIPSKILRGVLSSLTKKGLIEVDDGDSNVASYDENWKDPLIHLTTIEYSLNYNETGLSVWWNQFHKK